MRDVIIGYSFIFLAMFTFMGSMYFRKKSVRKRIADLKNELRDTSHR